MRVQKKLRLVLACRRPSLAGSAAPRCKQYESWWPAIEMGDRLLGSKIDILCKFYRPMLHSGDKTKNHKRQKIQIASAAAGVLHPLLHEIL